jgi:hypothetical protein
MKTFRTTCAKNNQKIELIVKYNSLEEAKESLHKQWYSIVEIVEISESEMVSGVFYFEAIINWEKKNGQIKSNDIFRAYKKLVDDLHYEIIYIYDNSDADEKEKILVTAKVRESFEVFQKSNKKTTTQTEEKKQETSETESETQEIPFFIQKELNKYYLLIDRVIEKIENILTTQIQNISTETKEKLIRLIPALRQVKNITNIDKLRIVGETTLLKIGEVELSLLEKNVTQEKKEFLTSTNKLLWEFWSNKQVRPQTEDIFLKFKKIVWEFFTDFFVFKKQEKIINKQTYIYLKTIREINIYKQKLSQVNKQILMNFFTFHTSENRKYQLKKKLIIQNINILQNRIQNRKFSYTQLVKGFEYYKDVVLFLIQALWNILLYAIFLYALFFLVFGSYNLFYQVPSLFNLTSVYLIVLLAFFALLSKISKNITLITILSIIYSIFFIFIRVNLS